MEFKMKSNGIQNEIQWNLQTIPMESRLNPSLTDAESERDWQAIALRYAEGCFAGEPCVKGQRDRRDQGTSELQSFLARP